MLGALVRDPALTQGGTLLDALGWSFIAMVSALISACLGAVYQPTKQLTAVFLAFSCGLLISLLCFDLMQVALDLGGIVAALIGFFRFYAGESPDEDAPGAAAWQRWRENFRFDPRGMHVMGVQVDFGGCAAPDVARAFAAAPRSSRAWIGAASNILWLPQE